MLLAAQPQVQPPGQAAPPGVDQGPGPAQTELESLDRRGGLGGII